ncbi:hypothetical protein ABW20_dc0106538 [Dactylellina cionopaga]|nr:hypothetical protein ABW20_dc0106538 [Dactylellina cionopaga]
MVKRVVEGVSMGPRGFKLKSGSASQDNGAILSNISNVTKTDTVIIGNGPSALTLSYLLHGNEPWYSPSEPHPDSVLHRKLLRKSGAISLSEKPQNVRLYDVLQTPKDYDDLTCHFPAASSMSYSTAALPLNVLMDTLLRPLADIDLEECTSRVDWKKSGSEIIPHVVLGEEPKAGGQWAGDEIWFGDDEDEEGDNGLKTLSYADLLSLPGYSFSDHYRQKYNKEMNTYYRPTRRLVANYYATYPRKVGIEDVIYPGTSVTNVERINDTSEFNFLVSVKLTPKYGAQPSESTAHVIRCRNVVLGTGIFSHRLPPPAIYTPFFEAILETPISSSQKSNATVVGVDGKPAKLPLLVVGSGYTAADAILCNQEKRSVVHVYRWDPEGRPSPLRGCHPQAYPGYAGVYRQMKEGTLVSKSELADGQYQGFPNGIVTEVGGDGTIKITWKLDGGEEQEKVVKVADIKVCIGRRGRLDYLAPSLCKEIGIKNIDYESMERLTPITHEITQTPLARMTTRRQSARSRKPALHPKTSHTAGKVWVQHSSLRGRVEENVEVTPNVFIIGSLTGDSLVRFAMGGCVYSAGRIITNTSPILESSPGSSEAASEASSMSESEDVKGIERKVKRRGSKCVVA